MTWFSTTKNLLSKVKSSVEKSKATTATTKELQVTEIERKSERRSRKGSDRTLDLDDDEDYYGSDDPRMYNNNHEGTTTTNYGDQDYEDDENGGSGSGNGSGNGGGLKFNPNCPPISLLPSKSKYEIAIFGCGEFWNPQRVFQKLYGVKHVVVGYTGGYSTYPSFDNPQDHTYALYIEYNPKKISYTTLLHVWHLHDYPWEQDDQDDNNELNNNNNSHLHTQSAIYCITSKQYQLAYEFKFNVLLPKAIQRRRRSKNQQATRRKQFQQQLQHRYEYGDDVLCCRKQQQQLLQQHYQQYQQQQQQCCYPSTVIVDGYGAAQIHFGDNGNDTTSASSSGNPPNPITGTSTTSNNNNNIHNNNNNNNIELLYVHIGYVTIFYQAELYQQNYISKQIQQAKQQLKLWMDNEVNSSLYTIYE